MKLSNFTVIVTNACNYRCSYCPQKKDHKTIDNGTIETAINFFYPFFLSEDETLENNKNKEKAGVNRIGFYGGEPLLAFDRIRHTVNILEEKSRNDHKRFAYTVTINGSLLTEEILDFFATHKFDVQLSFDGLAQDKQREPGSLQTTLDAMKRIQKHPGIQLEINSVFTPAVIPELTDSIRFMIDHDCPLISFSLDTTQSWNTSDLNSLRKEMIRLTGYLSEYYMNHKTVPVKNFRFPISGQETGVTGKGEKYEKSIFRCNAGIHHLALTPEGNLWGCFLFHDFFKSRKDWPQYDDYSYGSLTDFIENYESGYETVNSNYSDLRQDFFKVEGKHCFLCPEMQECAVCPVTTAYSSGAIGNISCHVCELVKIERNAREHFIKHLQY